MNDQEIEEIEEIDEETEIEIINETLYEKACDFHFDLKEYIKQSGISICENIYIEDIINFFN